MLHSTITQDEYGTVFNSKATYDGIALELAQGNPITIAWTDGEGSQMDILFTMPKTNVGKILRRELRDEKKAAA